MMQADDLKLMSMERTGVGAGTLLSATRTLITMMRTHFSTVKPMSFPLIALVNCRSVRTVFSDKVSSNV